MSWMGAWMGGSGASRPVAPPLSGTADTTLEKVQQVLQREFSGDGDPGLYMNVTTSTDDSIVLVKFAGASLAGTGQEERISLGVFAHSTTMDPLDGMADRVMNALDDADTVSVVSRDYGLDDYEYATGPEGLFRKQLTVEVRG